MTTHDHNHHYTAIDLYHRQTPPCLVISLTYQDLRNQLHTHSLEDELTDVIERSEVPRFIIDFTRVAYVSSTVVGLILHIVVIVEDKGGQVRLCGMQPQVLKIFDLTNAGAMVDIYGELRDALDTPWAELDLQKSWWGRLLGR